MNHKVVNPVGKCVLGRTASQQSTSASADGKIHIGLSACGAGYLEDQSDYLHDQFGHTCRAQRLRHNSVVITTDLVVTRNMKISSSSFHHYPLG